MPVVDIPGLPADVTAQAAAAAFVAWTGLPGVTVADLPGVAVVTLPGTFADPFNAFAGTADRTRPRWVEFTREGNTVSLTTRMQDDCTNALARAFAAAFARYHYTTARART